MNMQGNKWIDNLIHKNNVEIIPDSLKISMEEQINLFYKQKRQAKEGFFERITRLYLSPGILIYAKNGLLAFGLMACIMFLAGVSTTTVSTNLSANSFVEMKLGISIITSLNEIESVKAKVFIRSQNGIKEEFTTVWKEYKWNYPLPEIISEHLKNLLSPDKLRQILDNRLKFLKNKEHTSLLLLNSPFYSTCKITLDKINFLPESIDGTLTSNGKEFKIIYNWKKRNIVSLTDGFYKRGIK